MKQKHTLFLIAVWLLVAASIVASAVTILASDRGAAGIFFNSDEEAELIERYARLEEIRTILEENYYMEVDDEVLMTGAIRGMMSSLEDPYTFYYTPEEMEKHDQRDEGMYHGIGLLVQKNTNGYIEIIRVYENSPAEEAGARAGDLILSIDGETVQGETESSLNDAVEKMKGEDGTEVTLTVLRDGKTLQLVIERGNVSISNVCSEVLSGNIGYINIFQFTGDDVTAFEEALQSLEEAQVQGLVIDLRNNPGGKLDDVVAIADLLLPEGVVVYTEDRAGSRGNYYSDEEYCKLPLAVLINDMSASASEILAAAVQDYDRGSIVGTQSYGKGIVQTLLNFEEDGAGMQYTSAQYFTPSGKNIHGTGVTPDIYIEAAENSHDYSGVPDLENDVQLQAAVAAVESEIFASGE